MTMMAHKDPMKLDPPDDDAERMPPQPFPPVRFALDATLALFITTSALSGRPLLTALFCTAYTLCTLVPLWIRATPQSINRAVSATVMGVFTAFVIVFVGGLV